MTLVVLAGAVMTLLDTTIVVVAINELGHQFHTSLATVQWVMTGYLLALSMSIPVTGWAADRFGTRRVWLVALLLFITGSVLCGAAWSIGALIAFRVLQGFGGGLIMPVGQTILARAAGPERMGRIMAVIAVPAMLAPVLGPVLGGLIVSGGSWRWMFFVNVPICAVAVVLAMLMLPRDRDRVPNRLDLGGLALLSPGIALLVYGLSEAGKDNARLLLAGTAGAVLILGFGLRATRHARPLLDITLLRRWSFGLSCAGLFAYAGVMSGLSFVLPLYFQLVRGESPLVAGAMLAPLGLGAMVTMPISGRLTDRRDARGVAVAGVVTMATSVALYTRLEPDTSLAGLAALLFLGGLGHGLVLPAMQAAAYAAVGRAEIASGTTVANIVVRVGMSLGTAVLAVVLQLSLVHTFPATGGSLAAVGRLTDPASRDTLTGVFAGSLWWIVGFAVVALGPAVLLALRGSSQPKRPEM
ncbi:MAG TPA: DHA2 family efflux MFS transporter permease subunit [Micromonosporaceae bacterium]|nr:DHA2 family efflux MFS transporter permease subunit [Micromonosporaceae bacterium]